MDILSGRLWGFHIATYVFASSFIRLTSDRAEVLSYLYQAILLFLCSLVQGLVVLLYFIGSYGYVDYHSFLGVILIKSLIVTVVGVLVINWFLLSIVSMEFR